MRADRSGPLRLGNIRPVKPLPRAPELPALATISAFIAKRPVWASRDPFLVSPDLFEDAEAEMREQMKTRGFALPVSGDLARDGVRHFLLNGVAVVIEGHNG